LFRGKKTPGKEQMATCSRHCKQKKERGPTAPGTAAGCTAIKRKRKKGVQDGKVKTRLIYEPRGTKEKKKTKGSCRLVSDELVLKENLGNGGGVRSFHLIALGGKKRKIRGGYCCRCGLVVLDDGHGSTKGRTKKKRP